MVREEVTTIQDREQAGYLLSKKLTVHKNTDALVVGIAHGGAVVAYHLARALHLSFAVVPCRKIKHPANDMQTIGSVSIDDVLIHEDIHDIPQDYIYHQILMARIGIEREYNYYYANKPRPVFSDRTIIIVDDMLQENDAVLACLRSVRKQKPTSLIVAVPVIAFSALRTIREEADDVVFSRMASGFDSVRNIYSALPSVKEEEVRDLLSHSLEAVIHG
ncbi:phosphoribosyltransferase family protein [Ohtaekwangia kribbensis]|jgi:putative phosphoribosyl transferase|uniref:Phosphoribosyltransferase family protein n=1 Tax=Ohtaekwangia kribbensis TaxID=688913 RepID=A0ABW3KCC1_9BACT